VTDYDQRLLAGPKTPECKAQEYRGKTGAEYAEEMAKQEYVILVAQIVDTALIKARTPEEAANMYEFPPGAENLDLAVWALTREEFNQMVMADEKSGE